ncbi:MAG: type II toxin-antitoxin system VapC family toxin [Terrimicrobiaceae bacterium]
MKTALDTSVILDVLTEDAQWADASESALKKAQSLGQMVIGECVLAEITPALAEHDLGQFLSDWKILFLPSTRESASMAGEMYRAYLRRHHAVKRVLPDFLIGAHASHHTGRLLARDRGYYRDYFSGLTVIAPEHDKGARP